MCLPSATGWKPAGAIYSVPNICLTRKRGNKDYHRKGIGTLLYDELEKRLKEQGIVNLLAGVASCENDDEYLTHNSSKFHISKGYTQVAHMKEVGKKFGKWYDLLWYQKRL